MPRFILLILCSLAIFAAPQAALSQQRPAAGATGQDLERWLDHLERLLPKDAAGYQTARLDGLPAAADAIDQWAAVVGTFNERTPNEQYLAGVGRLLTAERRVDALTEAQLSLRTQFADLPAEPHRKQALRSYLAAVAKLIDLSGRLRYQLTDSIEAAAVRFAPQPALREQLIDALLAARSSVGADVMSVVLFDPPANSPNRAQPAGTETKRKLLELIAVTQQLQLLPRVANFARSLNTPPSLVVAAASAIRRVGLPQNPRPGQDPTLPQPPITAAALHDLLSKIPRVQLTDALHAERQDLLAWLAERKATGLPGASYQLGPIEVQAGDWLLMRNPSPYNQFTDLSPGLFTHVGVATVETGSDGVKRMVLVDLPERGNKMPATNVEAFVDRTLNYMLLRHPDPAAAAKMAAAASAVIGNPSIFDLNFRTDRVLALKGQSLPGKEIHTYCAGLLLLCAQETERPRSEFFPLDEGVAGGATAENMAKLGMSFGRDFISPTGALFSQKLQLVGRREPMFDSRREVEEAVFDSFAQGMETGALTVSPDLYQSLRLKLAAAAKGNAVLAQALAQAAGVGQDVDLLGAARAAAVVETLDEVAYGASGDFRNALAGVVYGGDAKALEQEGLAKPQIEAIVKARARHSDLVRQFERNQLTLRQLRLELAKFYIARGKSQIDQRFFAAKPATR